MDSSGSSISSLGAAEATQLLKDMLQVGKQRNITPSETSTASLASSVKDDVENTSMGNGESRVQYSIGEFVHKPYASTESDRQMYSSGEIVEGYKILPYTSSAVHGTSLRDFPATLPDVASSGNEADDSQSFHGDAAGLPERPPRVENGQASLNELLLTMGNQAVTQQQILLQGDDKANSFSVYGREVDIVSSKASALESLSAGSNKVKINPVVNFDWEHKHYIGNLVAVHRNGIHVAYVLRGKSGGIVRVINRKTAERSLVRGFSGRVVDVSFAHLSPIVLGAVDELGNMFIYEILEGKEGKIDTSLLLQINRPPTTQPSGYHRIIWCPYIPDEDETSGTTANTTTDSSVVEDIGKLLVLTHDDVAEMWNVDLVSREYGIGPLLPSQVEIGYLVISSHTKQIVDAAFSPDGTALATASLDGEVKFFQVYMHDKQPPRCLHEWKPHNGKPVSSLFFLDDQKHPNPEVQFWKYAVTGADNNSEIKIWSCESWICLQTVRILPDPELLMGPPSEPCLKAQMDLGANYLILTDIKRKVLYILQVYQDNEKTYAHVSSVSEFLLTQPCLSFAVLDASRRKFQRAVDQHDEVADLTTGEVEAEEDEEASNEEDGPNVGVLVRMYSVHTRALQELQIRFKPESSVPQPPPASMSSFSHDESGLKDPLSDLSAETIINSQFGQDDNNRVEQQVASPRNESPTDRSFTSSNHTTPRDQGSEVSTALSLSDRPTSAEHARAQAEAHLKDLIKGSYSGGAVAPSSSPRNLVDSVRAGMGQQRPLLMTPEAFVSSSRRDPTQVMDSIRSSGSSSFTQVTAMDDDQLRTPHASVSHNQPSPGSSITLTPASSRDMSAGGSPHALGTPVSSSRDMSMGGSPHLCTPTSVPLPPSTPGEEAVLSTSGHESLGHHPIQDLTGLPALPASTPPRLVQPHSSSSIPAPSNAASHEFYTSSPASHKPQDFRPPCKSDSEAGDMSSEALSDIFHARVVSQRQTLHSTGSSSSTSLEILEILEGAKKPGQDIMYEEESDGGPTPRQDQEDTVVEVQEETDKPSGILHGIADHGFDRSLPDSNEREDILIPDLQDGTPENSPRENAINSEQSTPSKYDERIWPKPPDFEQVQVDMEAQRLAAEAIQRAANLQQTGSHVTSSQDEDEDVVVEEHQRDGDVQIEEEKEEIIEEIIDEEGAGEIIIHTHDLPSSGRYERMCHRPQAIHIPSLQELTDSVRTMVDTLQSQQQEIEQLRSEIVVQRETADTVLSLQSHIANLESALASRLAGALDQHSQSETQRLQQVLVERESQERVKHDQLVNVLSQTLNAALSSKVEHCVKSEIRNSVVPSITQILEPVKQQLHNDIAQKLTATDALMKENINKLVRSRQTIESIGTAAGNAIQGPIQAACRDVLIPSFDRSCQNVCHQVNQTFQRGSQEYIHQLESHMEQVRRKHEESRDPIVHQLQAMVDAFKRREEAHAPVYGQLTKMAECVQSCTTAIQNSHTQLETKIGQSVSELQDFLLEQVQKILEEQVVTALREHQASITDQLSTAMRSHAPSPAPPAADPQQLQSHVLQLLRQGQLNSAFQQALSASDLKLVMFVCETVDPAKIFSQTPFPLQQPVLLSLIQQLSADLTSSIELKQKYLEEAIMNLDKNNPVTREHLPAVLSQLCQKLTTFIQTQPYDKTSSIRMLLMLAESLLK